MNTSMTTINNMVPVIAIEDEAQIADAQNTYIIYGYSENTDPRMFQIKTGVVSFNIKARTFGELGQIINSLQRAFENCDISATQLNAWKANYVGNPFVNMRFVETEVIHVDATPENAEGGPMHGVVNISYRVVVQDPEFVLPAAAQHTLWA